MPLFRATRLPLDGLVAGQAAAGTQRPFTKRFFQVPSPSSSAGVLGEKVRLRPLPAT